MCGMILELSITVTSKGRQQPRPPGVITEISGLKHLVNENGWRFASIVGKIVSDTTASKHTAGKIRVRTAVRSFKYLSLGEVKMRLREEMMFNRYETTLKTASAAEINTGKLQEFLKHILRIFNLREVWRRGRGVCPYPDDHHSKVSICAMFILVLIILQFWWCARMMSMFCGVNGISHSQNTLNCSLVFLRHWKTISPKSHQ